MESSNTTFNEFSKTNRTRCEAVTGFNHGLHEWSLSDWFVAICGELGEAANIVKKLNRIRDGIPGNDETEEELLIQLRNEMADTYIYLDLTAQSLGFQLGDAILEVFDAKSKKIGYRWEAAINQPPYPTSDDQANSPEAGETS